MKNFLTAKHSQKRSIVRYHKLIMLVMAIIGTVTFGYSQEDNTKSITVTIENIHNNKGHVILSLHNEDTFMKSEGIQSKSKDIVDGKITAIFSGVAPGNYAILAIHDENDNKRMDFEDNGMPIESYGMSNNSMSFGPPQFESAKFELSTEDLEVTIIF
ncbi:DUF2141 domain-containing protein [Changchengzhania lutea]|uniref:DUF2141 domain-containing protein n=1 Tax=Changchengzhania lutea TaxID=2049305 RepID=UPI001FEA90C5|nr:DUF2141 domain-containing protein [Changchengzhania lutea]